MKKLILLFTILFCVVGFSQIKSFESDYVEMIKKNVQEESRQIVKDNLELTEAQAEIFWPLYDEYDAAYDALIDERVKILQDYMMDYYAMDDETAKDLLMRSVDLNQKVLDMKKEYLNKMLEVLPSKIVGKFFQIDNRISALVEIVRMSSTPLVGPEE